MTKPRIQIISKGGTPSSKQIARPDLMKIIRFFLATYKCTNNEEIIELVDDSDTNLTSQPDEEPNKDDGVTPDTPPQN